MCTLKLYWLLRYLPHKKHLHVSEASLGLGFFVKGAGYGGGLSSVEHGLMSSGVSGNLNHGIKNKQRIYYEICYIP